MKALVFTDIEGSTALVERLGDAGAAALWTEHDRAARTLLAQHHGREIDRSDGFFLLFDRVRDAAVFALAYHGVLTALGLSARLGIHCGDVALRANRADDVARGAKPLEVEGIAKPLAARVMSIARGGQTLLSAAAREALQPVPAGCELRSHGHYRAKGIAEPIELFELGEAGCAFVPPADGEKAYCVVAAEGGLWLPRREIRHNLASERDAFIGRTTELRELAQRLDGGARLTTVLGVAGTGKTRFVRRYGRTWLGEWPGGVHFCDLSEARSVEGICFAVATAFEVPLGKDDPVVQLGHVIAGRGCCLVILDNFEQVATHAAATLGRWLDRANDATFVVTSRERLQLPGEDVFALEPLAADGEAIELFAVRAVAQRSGFVVDGGAREVIGKIVGLLDGLPLAIELAAARVRVLSPAQILQRLSDRFALLAGSRSAAARQATLKAAIDWSWELLAPWEQAALAQGSVFEGGFTMEAAEAVFDLGGHGDAPPVIDVVQSLVDKSLLRTRLPKTTRKIDASDPRFGMYISIHEYASKALGSGAAAVAAIQRHGGYFARFGTEQAIAALDAHEGVVLRRRLALDSDNLFAACRRALDRGDADVAVATYRAVADVIALAGPFQSGIALGQQVVAALGSASRSIDVHLAIARLLRLAGRAQQALPHAEQAQGAARAAQDSRREARALAAVGTLLSALSRFDEACDCFETALRIQRQDGDTAEIGPTVAGLARALSQVGEFDRAGELFATALPMLRAHGHRQAERLVLNQLGMIEGHRGNEAEVSRLQEAALALCREMGDRAGEGELLNNLGQKYETSEQCLAVLRESLAIHREVGNRQWEAYALGDIGSTLQEAGDLAGAESHFIDALALTRETGDRLIEGAELRKLGELYILQDRRDEAHAVLAEAEALLRGLGDKYYLARTLCERCELQRRCGDLDAARAAFSEAESIARKLAVGPASNIGKSLARLRPLMT